MTLYIYIANFFKESDYQPKLYHLLQIKLNDTVKKQNWSSKKSRRFFYERFSYSKNL